MAGSLENLMRWYSVGMTIFVLHFILVNHQALKRRHVWLSLSLLTLFWPAAYALSLYGNWAARRSTP